MRRSRCTSGVSSRATTVRSTGPSNAMSPWTGSRKITRARLHPGPPHGACYAWPAHCAPRLLMPTCSHCGFEVTPLQPAPLRCPQCGTPWRPEAPSARGVGLPPRFSEGDPGSTLFGVPDEFEREDSMLGDLSELHSAPKPASPPSQFRFAPPPLPPRAKAAPPPQKKEEEEVLHEELD